MEDVLTLFVVFFFFLRSKTKGKQGARGARLVRDLIKRRGKTRFFFFFLSLHLPAAAAEAAAPVPPKPQPPPPQNGPFQPQLP